MAEYSSVYWRPDPILGFIFDRGRLPDGYDGAVGIGIAFELGGKLVERARRFVERERRVMAEGAR